MVRRSWRALVVGLLLLVGALGVTACGSSDSSSTSSATTDAAAAPATSTPADTQAAGDDGETAGEQGEGIDPIAYTGGKAGAADSSLAPVTVGWMNNEGGPVGFPEATVSFQAAVKYINEELGGIQGHPLKVETCFVASSEEQAQQCAQKMVNNPEVKLIGDANMSIGAGAMYQTVDDKKPIIGQGSSTPEDAQQKAAWFWFISTLGQRGMATFMAEELKAKDVAIITPEGAFAQLATFYQDLLKKAGVNAKIVAFPATATDLIGPLTAAGVQDADAILASVDGPNCVRVYKALDQLGVKTPVVTTGLCMDPSVEKALGGDLPKGWSFGVTANPENTNDPDVALYLEKLKQYGGDDAATGGLAAVSFGQAMLIARILNKVGPDDITVDSVRKVAEAERGPLFLGPTDVHCGAVKAEPATCILGTGVNTYEGDGNWNTYGGKWFQ